MDQSPDVTASQDFVSPAEFARLAGVTPPTVSQWIKSGRIAGVQQVKAHKVLIPLLANNHLVDTTLPTRDELIRTIKELDPDHSENEESFSVAMIILAGMNIGTHDLQAIATLTELPLDFIEPIAERLRANEVWINGKTAIGGEGSAEAFWILVLIGLGFVQSVKSP